MRTPKLFDRHFLFTFFAAPILVHFVSLPVIAADPSGDPKSCQTFVQGFYDWYLAQARKQGPKDATIETALKSKKSAFGPVLTAGLKEDLTATNHHPGEVVGLDFDPVLNAQDTAEKLAVTKVTRKGNAYLVEVYGTWNGKKQAKPDVIPEVAFKSGTWKFENFHYPADGSSAKSDLLSVLQSLKKERQELHN